MKQSLNSLYKFVLTVSLLLAVEAKRADKGPSDKCPIKFPNGFYCNSICQESQNLKGNTVMCFMSNDGEYHRFVGRNPDNGTWRFYKVDETSDVTKLCNVSVNGDKFYSNKTDAMCSTPKSDTTPKVQPKTKDKPTNSTGKSSASEEKKGNSTSESTSSKKRLSVKELINKINEEVGKLFGQKTTPSLEPTAETEPTEEETPAARSAHRYALARSETSKKPENKAIPPMDDICQLVTTDVCLENKIAACGANGKCCWAKTDSEACKPESLKKYKECYKGLGVIMAGVVH